jgi:processive 1,2-diacylglycerol beta-glucosyltransferase
MSAPCEMKALLETETAGNNPVLILTIANGAGHTRAAQAIASAIRARQPEAKVIIADVADYMTPLARFTHVTAYLWLVKYLPGVWKQVDRYQKKQTRTSPEWYYRRGCRRLFEFARRTRPCALIATEVGCGEIAALIKRDLHLTQTPLIGVDIDHDADRAWVQKEVDLYCAATDEVRDELVKHGARREQVKVWGVPLQLEFSALGKRTDARREVCRWLALDASAPLLLVAGGSEGIGHIEELTEALLQLDQIQLQVIVLAGRNARLGKSCEKLAPEGMAAKRLRVLDWTTRVPELMRACDLFISKLGSAFSEALAAELPLIALEPPPGSERVQYRLLDEWGAGCAVRSIDEAIKAVTHLLSDSVELERLRAGARARRQTNAATKIAQWVLTNSASSTIGDQAVIKDHELEFESVAPVGARQSTA